MQDFLTEEDWEELLIDAQYHLMPCEFIAAAKFKLDDGAEYTLSSSEIEPFIIEHYNEIEEFSVGLNVGLIRTTSIEKTDAVLTNIFGDDE